MAIEIDIPEIVNKIIPDWEKKTINELTSLAEKRKLKDTGQLLDSLGTQFRKALGNNPAQISLAFKEYGRILDQRDVHITSLGRDLIDSLADWVGRNFDQFKVLPGYGSDRSKWPQQDIASRRLAFAIATAKINGTLKHKVRKWYNKAMYKSIANLEYRLLDAVGDQVLDRFKNFEKDAKKVFK